MLRILFLMVYFLPHWQIMIIIIIIINKNRLLVLFNIVK